MSHPVLPIEPMTRAALPLRGYVRLLAVAGLVGLGVATALGGAAAAVALAVAATLLVLALIVRLLATRQDRAMGRMQRMLAGFVAEDAAPSFTTDALGRIGYRNRAALARFGPGEGDAGLSRVLGALFADPPAVLRRLQLRAAHAGAAHEDVVTRRGHARLAVHRIDGGAFLWRLEEMFERGEDGPGAEGIGLPTLVVNAAGAVLAHNEALRRLIGGRPRSLDRVFTELPVRPGEVMRLATPHGPREALVAEVEGPGGQREIYLLPSAEAPEDGLRARARIDDLPVALLWLAGDGRVAFANRAARDMLRFEEGESRVAFADLVEGLGRPVSDWLADAMAGRGLNRPEVLRASRPEEEFYVQTVLRRVVTRGRPGLIAVLNDATEHKNLQSQFFQSQKMQAIGQFAGGIAHDFNNLLTAISGHCDLLLLRHDRGDPEFADLEQIRQNSNRAASLVGQLLAFSRKQTMQAEVLDLRETLSDLTHLLNRLVGEKVRLDFSHDDALRPIRADRRQLEQVMMNLVVNARDAMPSGGTIRIVTRERHLAEELHRDRAVVPRGDYAVVEVADEGVGIPPDRLPQIFEPFFTTKRPGEGTGLGLSTVYGIVKQSGGFIFVDSVEGQGATFTLYFPVHTGPAIPAAAPRNIATTSPSAPLDGSGVVLLVEDEAPVRAFASRALRLRGYTVLEAENAEQALEMLADTPGEVDLFVTDVIMPGMDGPTWVREALKTRPGVRVVFVSGYAEESFADAQARIPNSIFLPKPFSLAQLAATVQEQLALARS